MILNKIFENSVFLLECSQIMFLRDRYFTSKVYDLTKQNKYITLYMLKLKIGLPKVRTQA